MPGEEYLSTLNKEQVDAVNHYTGPALVVAGPGSGKTRVLTHRVFHLTKQHGISPYNILAITFTNKAAREMKERVSKLVPEPPEWVGTFHSTCSKILRFDGSEIGVPNSYNIYDTDDSVSMIKQIEGELKIDPKKYNPRSILGHIASAKQELIGPEEYNNFAQTPFQEISARVYKEYQKQLEANGALDFSDLIFKAVELLRIDSVREKYNSRFKFILVDEYQDTNKAQYEFTKLLAMQHNNIFVVGDMAQAIYSWRGADYRNILRFKNDYPGHKQYNLTVNYRSTKNIIEASKNIIQNNSTNIELDVKTSNVDGEKISIYEAYSEKDEAEFIARSISQSNVNLSDIGILYRTNALSRNIEDLLMKYGIPYRIVGGFKFYARKEVKDVISFLKVINNPKDAVSWERIINIPPKGIGAKTFQKIKDGGFDLEEIERKTGIDYKRLIKLKSTLPTEEIVNETLKETEYIDYLESQNEDKEVIESRKENIKELSSLAIEFPTLQDFLEQIALVEESDEKDSTESKVTLMTLHAAKGLEFASVYMVGMEEGLFPHARSIEEREKLEEERRLCYVGVTRAKAKLYITYSTKRLYFGNINFNTTSRFLSEIPEYLIEPVNSYHNNNKSTSKTIDDFFDDVGL